ncbi:MAG: hypothetical protein B7Y36_00035 [Novosphingobium sp. 28-62-57]|uniref:hypothetical protein n=1 Tax=unclassified Novosphingobium TaxID=2644732 RepID=UPI000BCE9D98|nr:MULTISPECIES: hypothetical protein [unclassified Novosphingobium]OYW48848.1 MAG: hypothetical protein B7Z34_12370 [Novosphingobium sp. 12-62-10]OYZ11994.1 MAG: hypothetical protein B7Y36_00035 [Novosphingobium sp. 28-62-57]OYZ97384.1 MAG: hypothetical protein B7X96_03105 [Novosphingobium sp. 17-62-8]HQS71133.1 hypothetical protein [Novosphingobium sp.]
MLALVCTAVFVIAAAFAVIAIAVTLQGRTAQIKALLAEYRTLQRDREFLVQITTHGTPAPRGASVSKARTTLRRAARPFVEVARSTQPLRAAA